MLSPGSRCDAAGCAANVLRDPNGGARSDPTDTAANIIAAITQAGVGNTFEFTIRNTADAAETITVTAGTGVTLSGTMTIAQNNSKRFLCVVTIYASPAPIPFKKWHMHSALHVLTLMKPYAAIWILTSLRAV